MWPVNLTAWSIIPWLVPGMALPGWLHHAVISSGVQPYDLAGRRRNPQGALPVAEGLVAARWWDLGLKRWWFVMVIGVSSDAFSLSNIDFIELTNMFQLGVNATKQFVPISHA